MASIHPKVFLPLRDTLTGRHLALLASGPTLQQAPRIDGCLTAACNNSYTFLGEAGPDYYFASDFRVHGYIESALRALPESCRIFLGYSIGPLDNPDLVIPLHLRDDPRVRAFCDYASPIPRLELELYPVFHFSTVVHCMLHIALYMNPDVIYLLGCDSVPTGYFDARDNAIQKSRMNTDRIKHGYLQLQMLQRHQRPHIRIVSVNPIGLRGVFEDVYTPQFLALHPELRVSAAQVVERI